MLYVGVVPTNLADPERPFQATVDGFITVATLISAAIRRTKPTKAHHAGQRSSRGGKGFFWRLDITTPPRRPAAP